MPAEDARFEVAGDKSPAELARHLGWPHHLIDDLIASGAITRIEGGWSVDTADLPHRWARAHWDAPGTAEQHDEES